jgi:thiol-disulfide isomerase/thioredoxin
LRPRDRSRKQRRRILIITLVVGVIVILVVVVQFLINSSSGNLGPLGQQVPQQIYNSLHQVAENSYGDVNLTLMSYFKHQTGQEWLSEGKPVIVYIGAEFCPFCAFLRWPLTVALMRFGNISGLEYMRSAGSPEVFPDTATFSFRHINYSSKYVVFQAYELEDRNRNQIESLPSNYSQVFSSYGSAYPFLSFANVYVLSSSIYSPSLMQGKNWTQIVSIINSQTELGYQVRTVANAITAVICKITKGTPENVCSKVSTITEKISFNYSEKSLFIIGTPSRKQSTWATLQYGHTEWITNIST